MGVCGCGKSAVGEALAARLGAVFLEGDAFHPPENVAKMSRSIPLTDADRLPWLRSLRERLGTVPEGDPAVLACSALKRRYRDILCDGLPRARFVYLRGTFDQINARMAARSGHFMPPDLLKSQFEALEEPGEDEGAVAVGIEGTVEEIAAEILAAL